MSYEKRIRKDVEVVDRLTTPHSARLRFNTCEITFTENNGSLSHTVTPSRSFNSVEWGVFEQIARERMHQASQPLQATE